MDGEDQGIDMAAKGHENNPQKDSAPSRRASQLEFTLQERSKEGAHRTKPLGERVVQTVRYYKWSIVVTFVTPAIIGIINAAAPDAVSDLKPKWEAYVTIVLTTIGLLLMMDNKPPELVGISDIIDPFPHPTVL